MERFCKFTIQILYAIAVPVIYLAFILLYRPPRMVGLLDMDGGWLDFNVVIVSCILLLVLALTRTALVLLRKKLNLDLLRYALWCLGEVLVFTAFASLYLTLMRRGAVPYFQMFGACCLPSLSVLIWPYLVFNLWIMLDISRHAAEEKTVAAPDDVVRFKDENQRLKLAVAVQALLYIEAKENYVTIVYLDGDKVCRYLLRSSMKRLEEMLRQHGLRRCHRAYFINPKHIKVLRKDSSAGYVFADLDAPSCPAIPVSKTYHDEIAGIL